jgi:peptide chain release factor subunit 1
MDSEMTDQDLIDHIALNASQTGTKVEVVSGKTEHGVMLGSLGNIAAILRYNPNRN